MIACPRCGHHNADDARYCSNCAMALRSSTAADEVRKTVTALFTDVVESTALGEQIDPEALRHLMTRYFDDISSIVERHGGTVEKYIGDAVMAVFGVPVLHEDDALRGIRAAIEIRDRVAVLNRELEKEDRQPLAWRTGINTGEVVAGDVGAGQRFVSGDAVNVAARLEQAAGAGEILLGEATYSLVRPLVETEPVAGVVAKGKSGALIAHRLVNLRAGSAERGRRLDAPMVGRRRQRRLLEDAYEEIVEERVCHLFTILGSAGVGKSRLASEFLAGLGPERTVLRGQCLSYGDGVTYWPIAAIIRQAAGINDDDDDATVLDRLTELLDGERDAAIVVKRLGELLGVAPDSAASDETSWAVRRTVEALGRRRPLIIVLDDMHWAEPTLLDLVDGLADAISESAVLLICLARRGLLDTRPAWGGGKAHATTITLEPLNERESRELVANLLGQAELSGPLAERITTQAEGNPLFAEEMLGMLIDSNRLVQRHGTWVATQDLAQVAVPPNIQALLAARIDALERGDRLVLERASVEGHVFHRAAVTEMAPADLLPELPTHLDSLSRREMIRPEGSDGGAFEDDEAFRFRHLLIRDAAYGGIPKTTRAELHGRLAEWLLDRVGDRLTKYEEILGYHYQQAYRYRTELGQVNDQTRRLGRSGAVHLGAAGQRALDRGDVTAATKLLGAAAEMLPVGDPLRTRFRADLALAIRTRENLLAAAEILAPTIEEARTAGDEAGLAYAELVLVTTLALMGELNTDDLIKRAEKSLEILRRHGDGRGIDRAIVELATAHFFAGQAGRAEKLLLDRMAARPELQHDATLLEWLAVAQTFGPTPIPVAIERLRGVLASAPNRAAEADGRAWLGALLGYLGEFDEGRRLAAEGIAMKRELGHADATAIVSANTIGRIEIRAGNLDAAMTVFKESFDQLSATDNQGYASAVAGLQADVWLRLGNLAQAEHYAQLARQLTTTDDVEEQMAALSIEARVRAARGDPEAALAMARQAAGMAAATDYLEERGETFRHLAEVELAVGNRERAIEALRRALSDFEAKGATVLVSEVERRLAELGAPADTLP